jgi:hypothetical protein
VIDTVSLADVPRALMPWPLARIVGKIVAVIAER